MSNNKDRIAAIVANVNNLKNDSNDLAIILSKLPQGVAKQLYKDGEVAEILKRHGIEG